MRPSSGTTPASHPLRGIIALGHSALTGENSDPQRPGMAALQNSWATGTNPAIDSIYQRLAAVDPTLRGHVVNAAAGGAPADALVGQATEALKVEPNPRLVIIQTIDNDIRCDGSDRANYPVFGRQVKAAVDLIARQAPRTWPIEFVTLEYDGLPVEMRCYDRPLGMRSAEVQPASQSP